MLFIFSLLLLLTFCLFASSSLKVTGKIAFLLSLFLMGYSLNILVAQISGFCHLLSNEYFYLLLQAVFTILAVFIWIKRGKPYIFGPFRLSDLKNELSDLPGNILRNPLTFIFTLVIMAGYIVLAWLVINVPPSNADSMQTHLSRVIYWLQQDSLKHLNTFSGFANLYPFDANLNFLWTILFSKTDRFVGFIQFFSAIFCAVSIFGLCRLLGGSKRSAWIVSLLWMTLPMNVYQATTTQNDLAVSVLLVSSIYLLFYYLEKREFGSLIIAGIAMGLAVGTKVTVGFVCIGLIVIIILAIVKSRINTKAMLQWILISFISLIFLGSYIYINDIIEYFSPTYVDEMMETGFIGDFSVKDKFAYNLPRFAYQYFSFDSLPKNMATYGVNLKKNVVNFLPKTLKSSLESNNALKDNDQYFDLAMPASYNEDNAWFGPISFLLITPAFFVGIYKGFKRKDILPFSLIALALSFYFFVVLLRPGWDPYQSRYFILATACIFPISVYLIDKTVVSKIFTVFLYSVAFIVFFMATLSNESKPLIKSTTYSNKYVEMEKNLIPHNAAESWYKKISMDTYRYLAHNLPYTKTIDDYDEVGLRTINDMSWYYKILTYVNKNIPEDTTMGLVYNKSLIFDYYFFGDNFERKLVPVKPNSLMFNEEWIKNNGIHYLLVSDKTYVKTIPDYLTLIYTVNNWAVYEVNK